MGYAIDSEFYGVQGDYLKRLQQDARSATLKTVNALLKKNIHPDKMEIVVVTPDPEAFKKQILGASCPITYAPGIEKPKKVTEEDKMISTYSLGIKSENISVVDSESLFEE